MEKIKKHKLVFQIEHDYFLIGIHSVLEDYRLAYFLNETFDLRLKRNSKNITFTKKEGSFSNYDFENPIDCCFWSLIKNKYMAEQKISNNLFNMFDQISNTYILIPEKKNIDYFLKIEGNLDSDKIKKIITKINSIYKVMTNYQMDPEILKSKDFLIF